MWSFVYKRKNKQWVWLAQWRRTRQIVAYAIGDRSEVTCRVLWERIPRRYKKCLCYTDFWAAYAEVLPSSQHRATGKGDGQTCHIERFNNILRQRLGRFVRRFSIQFNYCFCFHVDTHYVSIYCCSFGLIPSGAIPRSLLRYRLVIVAVSAAPSKASARCRYLSDTSGLAPSGVSLRCRMII